MRYAYRALLVLCSLALVGCGGGGGGGERFATPVKVTIDWAERSRSLGAPSSALSVVITLRAALPGGRDFHFLINRDANTAAHTETYVSPFEASPGTWEMAARFYAQADGSGHVVGLADAVAELRSDGTGLPTLATQGVVKTVWVEQSQMVPAGRKKDLGFSAGYHTLTGGSMVFTVVAVTPGSAAWQVVGGSDRLRFVDGRAEGLRTGAAWVTATVDGVTSPPERVTVTWDIPVRQVDLVTSDIVYDPVSRRIYASVPSRAGARGDTITTIDPATGAIERSVSVGSEPGSLGAADDGSCLYVSLDGPGAVRRFDIPTQAPGPQFSLGTSQTYGRYVAGQIAVAPGQAGTVAVSRRTSDYSSGYPALGVVLFRNGVQAQDAVPPSGNAIAFGASPARLYSFDPGEGYLRRMSVTDAGIQVDDNTPELMSRWRATQIVFAAGLLYSNVGDVVDPEALSVVGTIPVSAACVCPDPANGRVVFALNRRLVFFRRQDLTEIGTLALPADGGEVASLIRCGSKGFALRDNARIYIVDPVPDT